MTHASLDELLKEWDEESIAYAEMMAKVIQPEKYLVEMNRRIYSLIAVVRKQREALEFLSGKRQGDGIIRVPTEFIDKALTEAERILNGNS